ncbi:MAG: hypothetical protein AAGF92_15430 [Myxococcota bacterium]
MEIVKKTPEYEIIKKRSGRYGVRNAERKWVNGEEKVKILLAEKLIKAPEPKKEEPAEAAEEAGEGAEATEAGEATEDAPAEDGAEETTE